LMKLFEELAISAEFMADRVWYKNRFDTIDNFIRNRIRDEDISTIKHELSVLMAKEIKKGFFKPSGNSPNEDLEEFISQYFSKHFDRLDILIKSNLPVEFDDKEMEYGRDKEKFLKELKEKVLRFSEREKINAFSRVLKNTLNDFGSIVSKTMTDEDKLKYWKSFEKALFSNEKLDYNTINLVRLMVKENAKK